MDHRFEARGGKRLDCGGKFFGTRLVDINTKNACELPRQVGHATLDPVAAMFGDGLGDRIDQSGPVLAEEGEDEGSGRHGVAVLAKGRLLSDGNIQLQLEEKVTERSSEELIL